MCDKLEEEEERERIIGKETEGTMTSGNGKGI